MPGPTCVSTHPSHHILIIVVLVRTFEIESLVIFRYTMQYCSPELPWCIISSEHSLLVTRSLYPMTSVPLGCSHLSSWQPAICSFFYSLFYIIMSFYSFSPSSSFFIINDAQEVSPISVLRVHSSWCLGNIYGTRDFLHEKQAVSWTISPELASLIHIQWEYTKFIFLCFTWQYTQDLCALLPMVVCSFSWLIPFYLPIDSIYHLYIHQYIVYHI